MAKHTIIPRSKYLFTVLLSLTFLLQHSSGYAQSRINIYFNTPVNNTVSTGTDAIYLHNAMADTLIAYLNRAKYTVDIAQYDYNQSSGFSSIATAVNACFARGVQVRWIYDGSQPNTGLALLNAGINKLASPTTSTYGIMHDKFVIIDANSTTPTDAIVSTGSEDWGVTQLNSDNNNILFIQDSTLANAYLNEFNMMWGSTTATPNAALAKFGPYKTDLGAHIFNIDGKTIELYFSPSDHTNTHIESAINSANTDLYFGVYTFTESPDATAIIARQTAGVYTLGIVDQYSETGAAYPILTAGMGSQLKTYTNATLIYHNKMVIVDPSNTCSDPLVLTGSHNWTVSADTKNDENTLIIHNDTIANIYYQSFYANYTALGGTLTPISPCLIATCGTPTGLAASSLSSTSELLTWIATTGATSYTIQYRITGATTWTTTTSATNTLTISGLSPATDYECQVQATCASGTSSFSTSVDFTTPALPCSTPASLSATLLSPTSANLSWVTVSGAVSYNIQYRPTGTTTWLTTTTATNSTIITGLTPGTTYEFQVQVDCGTGTSAFSPSATFTTDAIITTCPQPTGLSVTAITPTSAMLTWPATAGSTGYNVQYLIAGTTGWQNLPSATNTATLTGLMPRATYECRVEAYCTSADSSAYSPLALFITHGTTDVPLQNTADTRSLTIYPNPTTNTATISYYLTTPAQVSITLYNIVGQEITPPLSQSLQQPGDHQYHITLPAPGIYFIRLTIGEATITGKVVKL